MAIVTTAGISYNKFVFREKENDYAPGKNES